MLGLSFFVGGLGRRSQKFHRTAATNTAAMLFLAVVALVMPAVFDLALFGSLDAAAAGDRSPELLERDRADRRLCRQPDLRLHGAARSVPRRPGRRARWTAADRPARPVGLLAAGTLLTTVQAELLVGALEPALARFGFTELFVGVIVVAMSATRPSTTRP